MPPQVGDIAGSIRAALTADGFDRAAYYELVTHNPAALTDRECGAVLAWALLGEVDRLTADRAALRIEHDAVRGLLTHTRRDRDEARGRVAELESRPTYADGVREAIATMEAAGVDSDSGVVCVVNALVPRVFALLLEPKP